MMNMMMPNSDGGIGYTTDDRFRKKMASKRVKVRCCCCLLLYGEKKRADFLLLQIILTHISIFLFSMLCYVYRIQ